MKRLACIAALCLTWTPSLHAQSAPPASVTARAERILDDREVFSEEFVKRIRAVLPDVLNGNFPKFGMVIPTSSQPALALVKAKFGPPDAIHVGARSPDIPGAPPPVIDSLYRYGFLELGVPLGEPGGKIQWVNLIKPE